MVSIGKLMTPTNSHIFQIQSSGISASTKEAEALGALKRLTFVIHDSKQAQILES